MPSKTKKIPAKKVNVIEADSSLEEIENEIKETCEMRKKLDMVFVNKNIKRREK